MAQLGEEIKDFETNKEKELKQKHKEAEERRAKERAKIEEKQRRSEASLKVLVRA